MVVGLLSTTQNPFFLLKHQDILKDLKLLLHSNIGHCDGYLFDKHNATVMS